MRQHAAMLAALTLVLSGCGSAAPVAQPPSSTSGPTTTEPTTISTTTSTTPTTSTTSSTPTTTTRTTNPRPLAPASSNAKDCFDGDCVLLLSKPTTIRLDAKTLHYSSVQITAISADSLSFFVPTGQGGSIRSTIGQSLGASRFGFSGSPSVEVGLTVVNGKPALVLQPGDPI